MARMMSFVGDVFFADVDAYGTLTSPWEDVGECYPMSMQVSEAIIKAMSRKTATKGSVVASKTKPEDASGSLVLHEYLVSNVARALRGMITQRNVSAGTITAEPVTMEGYGKYKEIGYEDLSSVVVQDATDTTTYVLGTDYRINTVLGLVAPIDGGSIGATDVLHVSASYAANTDQRLTIGAGSTQKVAIKGNLLEEYSGETMKVFLRMVTLASSKGVVFVSEDSTEHETLEFEMVPEIPTGQTDIGTFDGLPIGQ